MEHVTLSSLCLAVRGLNLLDVLCLAPPPTGGGTGEATPLPPFLNPYCGLTLSFTLGFLEIPSLEAVVFLDVTQLVPYIGGCQPSSRLSDLNVSNFEINGPFVCALIHFSTCALPSVEGDRCAKVQGAKSVQSLSIPSKLSPCDAQTTDGLSLSLRVQGLAYI